MMPTVSGSKPKVQPKISPCLLCSAAIELHPDLSLFQRQQKKKKKKSQKRPQMFSCIFSDHQWHSEFRGASHALRMTGFPMATGNCGSQPQGSLTEDTVGEGRITRSPLPWGTEGKNPIFKIGRYTH